jgi:hypothetical protein
MNASFWLILSSDLVQIGEVTMSTPTSAALIKVLQEEAQEFETTYNTPFKFQPHDTIDGLYTVIELQLEAYPGDISVGVFPLDAGYPREEIRRRLEILMHEILRRHGVVK